MNRALLFLAAALWAVTAQAGNKIEHWVAGTGARVYFNENHVVPIIDIQIDFSAGNAFDPEGKAGVASLTRALLDAGAGDLDEEGIAARLTDTGARLGGTTDSDRSSITLRTLSSAAEKNAALDLLHLILSRPTFPEAVVAREKARSIAAIQEADTRPDSIAAKRFAAAIYPGHPYGVTATVDSVGRIGRDDIVSFFRSYFGAGRAVVSIIGDVSRAEAERIAEALTGGLNPVEPEAPLPAVRLPDGRVVKVAHPATQSHIHVGLPSVRRGDPDYYALLVGNYTLGGGGFVSRLMKEVREKRGYAYSVHSYFAPRRLEGPFEMSLQTKRNQATEALKLAEQVLKDFIRNGPGETELAAAKKNLIDGLALRIDSNAKLLGYLSVIGYYNLPLTYIDDFPGKIAAVTARDVREAFARHVKPENLVTVMVAAD